jgi:uncharacterized protein (DUF58 family)
VKLVSLTAKLGEWHRALRPRRTIRPTREGWWVLLAAVGLGFAAINTGNNLLYLLLSMLLGLIVVSGVLSEQVIRGLRLSLVRPEEVVASRAALFGAMLVNGKRWVSSYSITIEILRAGRSPRLVYVPRLAPGEECLFTWEETLPRRGRQRLAGLRVTTLFPFGLFLKAGQIVLDTEVIVYPAIAPVPGRILQVTGAGATTDRRLGRGSDLYDLREYRWGDDPRLIHWRSSAKTGSLTVRELEAETTRDARIVLEPIGGGGRLEPGLSEAASLARHLIRSGASVGLSGPGVQVSIGSGRAHERTILTALALYEPPAGDAARLPARAGLPAAPREIHIPI